MNNNKIKIGSICYIDSCGCGSTSCHYEDAYVKVIKLEDDLAVVVPLRYEKVSSGSLFRIEKLQPIILKEAHES